MIEDGKFIPKWKHEWELKQKSRESWNRINNVSVSVNGHKYKVI